MRCHSSAVSLVTAPYPSLDFLVVAKTMPNYKSSARLTCLCFCLLAWHEADTPLKDKRRAQKKYKRAEMQMFCGQY